MHFRPRVVAPGDGPTTVAGDVTACVPSRETNFGAGDDLEDQRSARVAVTRAP